MFSEKKRFFPGTPIQYSSSSFHPQVQELFDSVAHLEKCFVATSVESRKVIAVVVDLQVILFHCKSGISTKKEDSGIQTKSYGTHQKLKLPPSSKGDGYRPETVVTCGEYLAACSSEGLLRIWNVSGKPKLLFELHMDICPVAITVEEDQQSDGQRKLGIFLLCDTGDICYVSTSNNNNNNRVNKFSKNTSSSSGNRLLSKVFASAFQAVTRLRDRGEETEDWLPILETTAHKIWTKNHKIVISLFQFHLEKWMSSEDRQVCSCMWSLDVRSLKNREVWYDDKEAIVIVDAEPFQDRYIACLFAIFWQDHSSQLLHVRYRIVLIDILLEDVPGCFAAQVSIDMEHLIDKNMWKKTIPRLTISGPFAYILFPLDGKVALVSLNTTDKQEEAQVKCVDTFRDWGIDTTPIGLIDALYLVDTLFPSQYATHWMDSMIGIITRTNCIFRFPGFCAPISYVSSSTSSDELEQVGNILFISFSQFIHGLKGASKWSAQTLYAEDMDQAILGFLASYLDMSGNDYSPVVSERIHYKAMIFCKFLDFTLLPIWTRREKKNIFACLSRQGKQTLVEYIQRTLVMEKLYELERHLCNEDTLETNFLSQTLKTLQEKNLPSDWTVFDCPRMLEELVETLQRMSIESKGELNSLVALMTEQHSAIVSQDKMSNRIALYQTGLLQLAQIFAVLFDTCRRYLDSVGHKHVQLQQMSKVPSWLLVSWEETITALYTLLDFLFASDKGENIEQLVMTIGEFLIALEKNIVADKQGRDVVHDIAKHYLKTTIFEIAISYERFESVMSFLLENHNDGLLLYSSDALMDVFQQVLTRALSHTTSAVWQNFVEYALNWLEQHGRFRILFTSRPEDENYRKALYQYIQRSGDGSATSCPRLSLRWMYFFQAKQYSQAALDLYTYVCHLWEKNEKGSLNNCHTLASFARLCLQLSWSNDDIEEDWKEDLGRRLYLIKAQKELSLDIPCLLDTQELVKKYVEESPVDSEKLYQRCGIALEIIEKSNLSTEESLRLSDYVWSRCVERELHRWQAIAHSSWNEQVKQKQFSELALYKLVGSTGTSFQAWKEIVERLKEENMDQEQHWTQNNSALLSLLSEAVYLAATQISSSLP
ncbi:hypothetical protein GAYE_PCTG71G1534 [Galdieria yellowstonensis]|uniref:Nuclear pore complex protein Nup160 n=1 Tax=Galdieria yellowstonensis TaxID=3028027 RepID=A0AAV9I8I0_9RHOD|nr:hypothetical protein GAYE_PCTG71G1534 [Galdieria yellowstonensis]